METKVNYAVVGAFVLALGAALIGGGVNVGLAEVGVVKTTLGGEQKITLARHALPKLLETTVIPVALFAGVLHFFGLWGAIIAGLTWSYAALFPATRNE